MNQRQNSELSRREVLKTAAAAGLALTAGAADSSQSLTAAPAEDNPVRRENANPGTREWMLAKTDITKNEPVELWRSPRIEGYCSATSVSAGESLKIMVSTTRLRNSIWKSSAPVTTAVMVGDR